MTYAEAMAYVRNGKGYVCADYMAAGWYLWLSGTDLFQHNPFHGEGPSGRDHLFRAVQKDRDAKWSVHPGT